MNLWKFTLPTDRLYRHPVFPQYAYSGMCAVARAESETDARHLLTKWAKDESVDAKWLDCREVVVTRLDPNEAGFVCWVQT